MKEYSTYIAPILHIIFRESLSKGQLPEDWKKAHIIPVFKKGNKHDASNYRPVSLTSICCKTLEHVVASHIMSNLDSRGIITERQHGFRARRSCETQLVDFVEDCLRSLDANKQIDVAVMDFSKAFDKVPHRRLLIKAGHYGIRGNLADWLDSFLSGRSQQVLLDGHSSTAAPVSSGVPQGTVLGPILFLIYINDIEHDITCNIRLFADDCILYNEISSPQDTAILQTNIDTLTRWERRWQMSFNITKCHMLTITRKRTPTTFDYTMHGSILSKVTSATYLGIEINSKLTWDTHIDTITAKANRSLGLLKRNLKKAPQAIKSLAYQSITRPSLEYGSVVWDPHQQYLISQVEAVQRRAARFVFNNYRYNPIDGYSSVTRMLEQLNWKTLERRRLEARLTFFHKAVYGLIALPINQYLSPYHNPRPTRHSHNLQYRIPFCRTDAYLYSFYPNTVRSWNSLPSQLVLCDSPTGFRAGLQSQQLWPATNP